VTLVSDCDSHLVVEIAEHPALTVDTLREKGRAKVSEPGNGRKPTGHVETALAVVLTACKKISTLIHG